MGLFSPWFLAGLIAVGLPLWLHLLRQFKRTPQPFSSLMFFERQIQSSSKHRRLRYFRLLALRLALLMLLALLFANPFVNRASSLLTSRKLSVIVIDRSFSMRFQNRIAEAKARAIQLVNTTAGAFEVTTLGAHTTKLTQTERDKNAIIDAINAVEPGDEASSYGEFSRAMRVMDQATGLNLDIHLFTDAQQTSMPTTFSDLQAGPHSSITIHDVGQEHAANWAVESISVAPRVYAASNIRLTAAVAGWQTKDAAKKVSVLLDGRVIATKDAAIPASGRVELEFNNLEISYGEHRGEVRLEPHDDLPNDDAFLFSVQRLDPRKVLFLSGLGRTSGSFFYKSALDASPATGLSVQAQSLDEASSLELSQYAFVVLNNPGEVDEGTKQRLRDYVAKGGAVLIAVGPATQRTGLIPLGGERLTATVTAQGARVMDASSSSLLDPRTFDNVQFLNTSRITADPNDRILASFTDGAPLLLEQRMGEGRLLIFASTLDNSASDFPVHASFLPFAAATGAYLAGSGEDVSSLVVGSAVALRQSKAQNASADVIGPDGKHEIPLNDATRVTTFNPGREGYFEVHRAGGTRLILAVHSDRRESNLAKVPAETLNLWRNTGKSVDTTETGSAAATEAFSLWRYFLSLLLIAAIVESLFASRYLSEERQTT